MRSPGPNAPKFFVSSYSYELLMRRGPITGPLDVYGFAEEYQSKNQKTTF